MTRAETAQPKYEAAAVAVLLYVQLLVSAETVSQACAMQLLAQLQPQLHLLTLAHHLP